MDVVNTFEIDRDLKFIAKDTAKEGEVGGVFSLVLHEGRLWVDKYVVLKQISQANGLHVKLDPEAIEAWVMENVELAYPDDGGMPIGHWGWWHHHCNAGVSPSSTDREFIEDHAMRGWFVTLIYNAKGDVHCQASTYAGGKTKKEATLIDLQAKYLVEEQAFEGAEALRAEVKEKVTFEKSAPVVVGGYSRGGWQRGAWMGHGDLDDDAYPGYVYGNGWCTKHDAPWTRCKCGSDVRISQEQHEAQVRERFTPKRKKNGKLRGHKQVVLEVSEPKLVVTFTKDFAQQKKLPLSYRVGEGPRVYVNQLPETMRAEMALKGVKWSEIVGPMMNSGGRVVVGEQGAKLCFAEETAS